MGVSSGASVGIASRRHTSEQRGADVSQDEGSGSSGRMKQTLNRVDELQQEHSSVGVPVAVLRKFSEDKSTNLASMIAFWAFFSIFPLFLVLVTLLGWFLPGDMKASVLHHVSQMFPLLNTSTVGSLSGSWWALIVGIVSALWSGSAVVRVTQYAFNSVWEIPMK